MSRAIEWAKAEGAHVTQTLRGDAEGAALPTPDSVDVLLVDSHERQSAGLEGQCAIIKDFLVAGA